MMKLKYKYIVEGIVVIVVMMILFSISIPLFMKSQKRLQIKNADMMVQTFRDRCVENPSYLNHIENYRGIIASSYHGIIRDRYGRIKVDNSKIVSELSTINIAKFLEENDEYEYYHSILDGYSFLMNVTHINTKPLDADSKEKLFYFSFSATNDPNTKFIDSSVIFDVDITGNYQVIPYWVIPFHVSNGLDSIGGFTYDSQEDLPLPNIMIHNITLKD